MFINFFCPWCNLTFAQTNKNGVAECPICKQKRNDGLNQIGINSFQCIICGCKFLNLLKTDPICPNSCEYKGGKNENKR